MYYSINLSGKNVNTVQHKHGKATCMRMIMHFFQLESKYLRAMEYIKSVNKTYHEEEPALAALGQDNPPEGRM